MKITAYKSICISSICLFILHLLTVSLHAQSEVSETGWGVTNFNEGWKFHETTDFKAREIDFDDSKWRKVNLPHDWAIENLPAQDSIHIGPTNKQEPGGLGYTRSGTGWYRNTLTLQPDQKDKRFVLYFDGVMQQAQVWVNNQLMASNLHGYLPFKVDITDALFAPGEANTISVKALVPDDVHSRWYTGAGIYREVQLWVKNTTYINPWDVYITTPKVATEQATVQATIGWNHLKNLKQDMQVELILLDPDGHKVAQQKQAVAVSSEGTVPTTLQLNVANPKLWDIDNPYLYTAIINLYVDDIQVDKHQTNIGIRSIDFSAEKGFLLNGKHTLLYGGCIHHDNGLLGASAFRDADERRLRILKESGFNAIRSSHNPASKSLLDACDRLGMLVIDEAFDSWRIPKVPEDYSIHFARNWQEDLRDVIVRGRNHPSIIMWSIGNEVPERFNKSGIATANTLGKEVRNLDPTRPVTAGHNGLWAMYRPVKEWSDTKDAIEQLDVAGYNYLPFQYEKDIKNHPNRIMYGSESLGSIEWMHHFWEAVEKYPAVIGDFVWTAMDYIGESGVGHVSYLPPAEVPTNGRQLFSMPYPTWIAKCGDIDIIGNKKPVSDYRDIVWKRNDITMAVHEPIPNGVVEYTNNWGWTKEEKHWNWQETGNKPVTVNVYTRYPKVRLLLNGKKIGEQEVPMDTLNYRVQFQLPWKKGTLKALALDKKGKVKAKTVLRTTKTPANISLVPEQMVIPTSLESLAFIKVSVTDKKGKEVNNANNLLTVKVSGPADLVAAGNGSTEVQGGVQDADFNVFEGKGLIILRSNGISGEVQVEVESELLSTKTVSVRFE